LSARSPDGAKAVAKVAASEVGYGLRFMRDHGWRILLVFIGLLLPLLGFAGLVGELQEGDKFFFDAPIMLFLHQNASAGRDAFFVLMSRLGYLWGVLPLDVGILAWLIVRRRYRDGLFFGLAIVGSLLLNLAAKHHFARVRPDLWLSLTPETTFSFPSGHAMGSVTLAVALTLLFWPTRGRWLVLAVASLFVLLVGLSRIYLGVHYPSDILAGWTAGTAWVVAMYQLVLSHAPPPPKTAAAAASPDLLAKTGKARA
jgi:undecaprenyl-diphosphatase